MDTLFPCHSLVVEWLSFQELIESSQRPAEGGGFSVIEKIPFVSIHIGSDPWPGFVPPFQGGDVRSWNMSKVSTAMKFGVSPIGGGAIALTWFTACS